MNSLCVLVHIEHKKDMVLLTSPPTACNWKISEQETLASSTSRPSSSNASSIETSKPGQFFSENTLIRKPLSRVSTVTCPKYNKINSVSCFNR